MSGVHHNCSFCNGNWVARGLCPICGSPKIVAARSGLSDEAVERAARYVLENSRRGKASLSDEQFASDTNDLLRAYRDIIRKAWASGALATASQPDKRVEDMRERCAKIAEEHWYVGIGQKDGRDLAAEMRALPTTPNERDSRRGG